MFDILYVFASLSFTVNLFKMKYKIFWFFLQLSRKQIKAGLPIWSVVHDGCCRQSIAGSIDGKQRIYICQWVIDVSLISIDRSSLKDILPFFLN